MQQYYQEGVTATVNLEQMNPLNTIIKFSEIVFKNTA